MKIIAGEELKSEDFFSEGTPKAQGSSFDLSIGHIFDHQGKKVDGVFNLKPGEIVQVASAEVFSLPANVTGHVTYKTTLTQKGIWALTVGIVDPGWDGPIATTLLNFSKVEYPLCVGDAFLRVSLFEHAFVEKSKLRKSAPKEAYLRTIQKGAASLFSPTFLNSEAIAVKAGEKVMERIQKDALGWIVCIALIFTVAQLAVSFASIKYSTSESVKAQLSRDEVQRLEEEIKALKLRLDVPTNTQSSGDVVKHTVPQEKQKLPDAK